jgi:glycosyltransferase involved in cell wall biosynthesis
MKCLLVVSLATRFGGGETYLEQLAPILRDRIPLTVFCIHPELKNRLQSLGIHTCCLNLAGKWTDVFRIPLSILALLYFRLFRGESHVVLNGHAPAALALPARLLGYRIFVVAHLNLTERKTLLQRLLLHRRYLLSLRFVDRIICVSEPVAAELRAIFPRKDIVAIPNWIADIPPYCNRRPSSDGKLRLLFVGRLVELKGLALLLSAMRHLPTVSLTVVGEGQARDALQKMALELDVEFVGFQKITRPYFERADIFVNPTRGPEGLPMVSLEAMAHGMPCILSDLPVHVDISQGGEAAVLFKCGSVVDLTIRISELIANPPLRDQYGTQARQMILDHYCGSIAKNKYLQALEIE